MTETLRTEDAYLKLRPVFLQGLAAVARQGFVTPPSDGMDIIHDFFLEEWAAVQRTFDAAKGPLEPYVYRAFIRFARSRIVRMRRLSHATLDSRIISGLVVPAVEPSESDLKREDIESALRTLGPDQRALLGDYLESGDSERLIASRHRLSRYRLRKQISEALWQVAVRLWQPAAIETRDWKVAVAVWRDARSIDETAALLGLSTHQVRSSLRRNMQYITSTLTGMQTIKQQARKTTMSQTVHELLLKTFASPGDMALLGEVRRRSEEILDFLEREDVSIEPLSEALDPEWTAQIYAALADSGLSSDDRETIAALAELSDTEEERIGSAWQQVLLPNLPPGVANLEEVLVSIAPVDEEEYKSLLSTPAVRAALPESERLAQRGLSPLTIFYTTDAVGGLLERTMRYECVSDTVVHFDAASRTLEVEPPLVTREALLAEIRESADLDVTAAEPLLFWALAAARHVPYLLHGLKTVPNTTGFVAEATDRVFDNVFDQWETTVPLGDVVVREQIKADLEAIGRIEEIRAVIVSNVPSSFDGRAVADVFASKGYRPTKVQMFVDRDGHALGTGLVRLGESVEPFKVVRAIDGMLVAGKMLTVSASLGRIRRFVDSAVGGLECTHGSVEGEEAVFRKVPGTVITAREKGRRKRLRKKSHRQAG
jgi:DNA-directed RNA polymerase specialized sigma24 family protein